MKTIMAARSPHDSSFSFSKRYFNWKKKPEDDEEMLTYDSSSHSFCSSDVPPLQTHHRTAPGTEDFSQPPSCIPASTNYSSAAPPNDNHKKKLAVVSVYRLRSLFTKSKSSSTAAAAALSSPPALKSRVVGTLFGYRRGHVRIAFQYDLKSNPAFLIELSTPTSILVREMASGLVRIALECDKKSTEKKKAAVKLLDEPLWRAYCNGKKCGYATRRECKTEEFKVLKAVEPITMGAGVLPREEDEIIGRGGGEGELMYMRAKFERVVGSKDSEAFYMMNPDVSGSAGPELSIYLLRA